MLSSALASFWLAMESGTDVSEAPRLTPAVALVVGVLTAAVTACAPAQPTQPHGQQGSAHASAGEVRAELFRLIDTWRSPEDLGPENLERAFDIDLVPQGSGQTGSRPMEGGELSVSTDPEGPNFRASLLFPLPDSGQTCALSIGALAEGLKARGHQALLSQVHGLRRSWSFPSAPRGGHVLSVYAITEPEAKSPEDTAPCVSEVRLFIKEATRGKTVP